MKSTLLLQSSTFLCLAESWAKNLTVLNDRPLSAAYWKLGEMTGEDMLDELPEWQVETGKLIENRN